MHPVEAADLFSKLKAEREPWLLQVFVQPGGCDQLASQQSSLIWGGPGAGKSALRLRLAQEIQQNSLVAHWDPEPPADDRLLGTPLFNFALEQALRASIESLVVHGNLHQRLSSDADWARTSLAWFLRKFLPFEPVFYIHSHGAALGAEQVAWYIHLLEQPAQNIMGDGANHSDLLRLLMFTLKAAGYQSVTLLVDGLEKWSGHSDERVRQMLDAILATLAVFDSAELVFKFFVPEVLRARFENSASVLKYRVNQLSLTWDAQLLTALVTRRIGLAAGRQVSAADFCPDVEFWSWLSKYGAQNPRAWLELAQPFAAQFQQNSGQPLDSACWRALAHQNPPVLHTAGQKVWLSACEIVSVTATEFDLLAYLEQNPGRSCGLEEIYFRGLQKLAQVPAKDARGWISKDDYRGAVDTALYRLRLKVETDPGQPVYLITTHGKGIRLYPRGVQNA